MAIDRDKVVAEALCLLDDEGLEALSLRRLGTRLGVQAPTLYWHIADKRALLDALADVIMDEALAAIVPPARKQGWAPWLLDALVQVRAAVLRHRDGARLVAGARAALRRADFSELAASTLVQQGVDPQRARLLVLTAERYTFGYVLEEQASDASRPGTSANATSDPDPDELRQRFPVLTDAIGAYFADGRTADDLFRDGLCLILGLG